MATRPYSLKVCDSIGRGHGEDIARSVLSEVARVDAAGEIVDAGGSLVDRSGSLVDRDWFYETLYETVEHFRQHSPFEFHAAAINARPGEWGSEAGWDTYERGFDRGVRVALRGEGFGEWL